MGRNKTQDAGLNGNADEELKDKDENKKAYPDRQKKLRKMAAALTVAGVLAIVATVAVFVVFSFYNSAKKMESALMAVIEDVSKTDEQKMTEVAVMIDDRGAGFSGCEITLKKGFYADALKKPLSWYNSAARSLLAGRPDITLNGSFLPDIYEKIFSSYGTERQKYAAMYYEAVKNYPEPKRNEPLKQEAMLKEAQMGEIYAFADRYKRLSEDLTKIDSAFSVRCLNIFRKCNPVGFFAYDFNEYKGNPPFQTDKNINEKNDYLTSGEDKYTGLDLLYYSTLFEGETKRLFYGWVTTRQITLADLITDGLDAQIHQSNFGAYMLCYKEYLQYASENILDRFYIEKLEKSLVQNSGISSNIPFVYNVSQEYMLKKPDIVIDGGFTVSVNALSENRTSFEESNAYAVIKRIVENTGMKYVPLNMARYIILFDGLQYEETNGSAIVKGTLYLVDRTLSRSPFTNATYKTIIKPYNFSYVNEDKAQFSLPVLDLVLTDNVIQNIMTAVFP